MEEADRLVLASLVNASHRQLTKLLSNRPRRAAGLRRVLDRCLQRPLLHIVDPLELAKELAAEGAVGSELRERLAKKPPRQRSRCILEGSIPASVLTRARRSLKAGTGTSLEAWICSLAFYSPEFKSDDIVRALTDAGALRLAESGEVEYSLDSFLVQEVEGWCDDFLSPWVQGVPDLNLAKASLVADTAVVVAPPPEMWAQFMRLKAHMKTPYPHVTLLPMFVSKGLIDRAKEPLEEALASVEPFQLIMQELKILKGSANIAVPATSEPSQALVQLQQHLQSLVPQSRYKFESHLGVGTFGDRDWAEEHLEFYHSIWSPLQFTVTHVLVLKRAGGKGKGRGKGRITSEPWTLAAAIPLAGVGKDLPPPFPIGTRTSLQEQLPSAYSEIAGNVADGCPICAKDLALGPYGKLVDDLYFDYVEDDAGLAAEGIDAGNQELAGSSVDRGTVNKSNPSRNRSDYQRTRHDKHMLVGPRLREAEKHTREAGRSRARDIKSGLTQAG